MQGERDKIILNAQGKPYVIQTESGLPATNAASMLEEMREYLTWDELERTAMTEKEKAIEEERSRICIWCGKVCESIEALEVHEADCA